MPAYVYPILIDRNKKLIIKPNEIQLTSDLLSVEDIKEIVGSNKFWFEQNNSQYGTEVSLFYNESRMETDEEQALRIEKEEAYMIKYHEYQKEKNTRTQ